MSSSISTLISSSFSQTLKIRTLVIPLSPHTLLTSKTPPSSISLTNMFNPQPNEIPQYPQRAPPEIPSLPKVQPSPVPSEQPLIHTRDPETDPHVPPEIVTDPAPGHPNPKPDAPKPPLTPPGIEIPLPKPPEKMPKQPPEVDPPRPPEILPPPIAPPDITPPTGPRIFG
ncbi:hypothetical protein V8G54_031234 [Vigna mungo]|uniref:Uncharacterized protein n=1 Tax=Vigna mungo TaxID=3915 RepID=A0AAQ3MXU4_VIGMU